MTGNRLQKWEIALLCAVAVTLVWGRLGSTPGCAWWGAVYPELAPDAGSAETALVAGSGVVLRFQLLEWMEALLRALHIA